jgi:hypothetical protein
VVIVVCPVAMHLILNSTCFNLTMRDMSNIMYIPLNELVIFLESVLNLNMLLHKFDSFDPCVQIYMGDTPQLDTNEPV